MLVRLRQQRCGGTPTGRVLFLSTYADVDVSLTPAVRRRGAPALTLIHDFIMGWKCLKGGDANEEVLELQCLMFSRRVLWTFQALEGYIFSKIVALQGYEQWRGLQPNLDLRFYPRGVNILDLDRGIFSNVLGRSGGFF